MLTGMGARRRGIVELPIMHCGVPVHALGISDRAICPKCRRVLTLIRGHDQMVIGCEAMFDDVDETEPPPTGGKTDADATFAAK